MSCDGTVSGDGFAFVGTLVCFTAVSGTCLLVGCLRLDPDKCWRPSSANAKCFANQNQFESQSAVYRIRCHSFEDDAVVAKITTSHLFGAWCFTAPNLGRVGGDVPQERAVGAISI